MPVPGKHILIFILCVFVCVWAPLLPLILFMLWFHTDIYMQQGCVCVWGGQSHAVFSSSAKLIKYSAHSSALSRHTRDIPSHFWGRITICAVFGVIM